MDHDYTRQLQLPDIHAGSRGEGILQLSSKNISRSGLPSAHALSSRHHLQPELAQQN